MTPLDQALPGFGQSCVALYGLLLPWGLALLVTAFAFEFWHGPPHPGELLKFLLKIFLIVILLAKSHELINNGQAAVQDLVKNHIPASPEKVARRYKDKIAEAQDAPELKDESFFSQLFSSNWFEAIIFAFLTLLSWLAMALLFFVYTVQRAALLLCWALSPLLFPLLAIRPLSHLGLRHLLRTLAIMLWPLALALAATLTSGLIDVAADRNFLSGYATVGSLGRGLISMLAVTVITIWILFSTIAGPVFLQRLIVGDGGSTVVLSTGAQLLANIAAPSYFGLPQAFRGLGSAGQAMAHRIESAWRWTHRSEASSNEGGATFTGDISGARSPAQSSTTEWQSWRPSPDDPVGDRQARATATQAKTQ